MNLENNFWQTLQDLLSTSNIIIDRPRGNRHPHHPELIYPLDYGYLEATSSTDGGGIDVWMGSKETRKLTGILCTFDTFKRDVEIKLLIGCSPADVRIIKEFNNNFMQYLYIPCP